MFEGTTHESAVPLSSLHVAAADNNVDELARILEAGAYADETDGTNWTPLQFALLNGCEEAACLLLRNGAEPDQFTESGLTVLQGAAYDGQEDIVAALLEAGAEVDLLSERGETALSCAAHGGHLGTMALLCSYGASRAAVVCKGCDQLIPEVAAWLQHTADYTTPLHHLCTVRPERALALLREGADIDFSVCAGAPTPLGLAHQLEHGVDSPEHSTPWLVLEASKP
jgi:FOG: Ankyrin repeat